MLCWRGVDIRSCVGGRDVLFLRLRVPLIVRLIPAHQVSGIEAVLRVLRERRVEHRVRAEWSAVHGTSAFEGARTAVGKRYVLVRQVRYILHVIGCEPLDRVRIVNKQSVAIHPRAHVGEGPVLGRVAGQAAEPELRAGFGGVELYATSPAEVLAETEPPPYSLYDALVWKLSPEGTTLW